MCPHVRVPKLATRRYAGGMPPVLRMSAPLRKRMVQYEIPGGARFITFNCQRRLPLLRHARIARLLIDRLAAVCSDHGASLYAYVVMPEHVHLLLAPARPVRGAGIAPCDDPPGRWDRRRWRGFMTWHAEEAPRDTSRSEETDA
jgi:hypothetical protein